MTLFPIQPEQQSLSSPPQAPAQVILCRLGLFPPQTGSRSAWPSGAQHRAETNVGGQRSAACPEWQREGVWGGGEEPAGTGGRRAELKVMSFSTS